MNEERKEWNKNVIYCPTLRKFRSNIHIHAESLIMLPNTVNSILSFCINTNAM